MDKSALRPETFLANMPSMAAEQEAAKKGATEEEVALANMGKTHGWRVLREYIGKVEEDLDNKNAEAIAGGKALEEIGLNTIVINLTKEIIKKVLDKVEDAKEACEK